MDTTGELDVGEPWPELMVNHVHNATPRQGSALAQNLDPQKGGGGVLAKGNEIVTSKASSPYVILNPGTKEKDGKAENNQGKRVWVGLFYATKLAAKGMNLSYIPRVIQEGEMVVQLTEEDVEEENEVWVQAVVLYVVGNTPSIGTVERFIGSQWNFVHKAKMKEKIVRLRCRTLLGDRDENLPVEKPRGKKVWRQARVLDPSTNPLIDDKGRYKAQLVGEGEKGKEKFQEEQQWSNPIEKSTRRVAQHNLQEVGTSNGFEILEYYDQMGRNEVEQEDELKRLVEGTTHNYPT
ncbi:hypothetical protein KY290_036591 [Solanum tuberosum]|uniref:DUF4283 domain-containing protein n=1 Tax=Solanum tuberosum TaxID=4113 RepID=A0ABQ7TTK0_SOLTU|nr:hypothetical protein KY285_035916 [Solanum tuberosum]KAH0737886.1 hypothetical protein KY290_036591 [Solanum tuberosum]